MRNARYAPFAASVLALALGACSSGERSATPSTETSNVVTITARGLTFEAPDRIPSGWITFRFRNESEMVHFAILEREGMERSGIEEHQRTVAPVFQKGMNFLNEGSPDSAMAVFGELPPWFGPQIFHGGIGLTSPGQTSETTLHLEPGYYLIECYVKSGGIFHSYNPNPKAYGMVHEFIVTEEPADYPVLTPTLRLVISNEKGIEMQGEPTAGKQVVAVHFADQKVHENFVQSDVHLVRLADGTDLDRLAAWMNWMDPKGLEVPAPATFLGGAQEMSAGGTEYLTVTLKPGRYAWISEVPDPAAKHMLVTFEVPGEAS